MTIADQDTEQDTQRVTAPALTPVQKFGEAIADRVERWMPSPFLFAILLTYVAAGAAFFSEGSGVTEIALSWYGGLLGPSTVRDADGDHSRDRQRGGVPSAGAGHDP